MVARPFRWSRRHWKKLAGSAVLVAFLGNIVVAHHARAFLTYSPSREPTAPPESLSTREKVGLLLTGVSIPRPINHADPSSRGLPFSTHRVEVAPGWLELWHVPADPAPRGVVLLFPGYAAAKSSLLPEAIAFRRMGFDAVLVDFRGAGGSSGQDTTLGIREAEDVAAAADFAARRYPGLPLVLFGRSMGATAVIRAVGRLGVNPAAVVVECPFDRMLNAVRNRFTTFGVPSFPAAELLVFWGGRHHGFDGFAHNPVADAAAIRCPTLVLAGSTDPRATPAQVRAVHDALPGPKGWHLFDGIGHEPYLARCPSAWNLHVSTFLGECLP